MLRAFSYDSTNQFAMQTQQDPRAFPLLTVESIQHQVTRHVLRDGTHELRAGLIAMVPSGLWLVWLMGVRGVVLGVALAAVIGLVLAAGPGVTALRTRYVIPRLGYARHTQTTDLATLSAVAIILTSLALVWLEQGGTIGWGRIVSAVALPCGFLILARESTLGRHYLVALLSALVGAAFLALHLPPFQFFAALVLAAALLLALGGAAALRSLVVNHPEADAEPGDDAEG